MFFVQCSCGKIPEHDAVLDVGEFHEYVTRFEVRAVEYGMKVQVTDLVIRFGELENQRERGVCEIVTGQTPVITINKKRWNLLEEVDREILLFHEMGHCVLKRLHHNELSRRGAPQSMMHAYALDRYTYLLNESYYLEELFSHTGDF